jgi:SAM-dependent methyltransferase
MPMQIAQRWIAFLSVLVLSATLFGEAPAQATRRAPDVRFDPTPERVVVEMLKLAQVGASDVVYDLGCGDGRIVITAAKQYGARGVCVDIDPQRIRESRANAGRFGVAERIAFREEDLFETELRDATVVTLFLWPSINLKLRPRLWRELKPGTRVVSYVHDMGDWMPQEVRDVQGAFGPQKIYLWIIPADGATKSTIERSSSR